MVKVLFYSLVSVILVATLVVTAEFGLWVIWNITKSSKLDN